MYDEASALYLVDFSAFDTTPGQDELLMVMASGYESSAKMSVVSSGVRVCGPRLDFTLVLE